MRYSQAELAEALGLDTTTIKNCQRNGLPYVLRGKGKPSEFIPAVAFNWYLGYRVSRDRTINLPKTCRDLSGPTDPLAFQIAVSRNAGDKVDVAKIQEYLRELGQGSAADALPERIGFFKGVISQ